MTGVLANIKGVHAVCALSIARNFKEYVTSFSNAALRPQRPYGLLLGRGTQVVVECCFTSTETVGLLGTGAQDGHLDFHTPPESPRLS